MYTIEAYAEVDTVLDDLVEVYLEAFDAPDDERDRFRNDQLPRHSGRTDFRLRVARADGRVVGFSYGYTGQFGQWWTDRVRKLVPNNVADEWLDGHFEFVEFAVLPSYQGKGIGTSLHDDMLAGLPHDRALLCTHTTDTPAGRLYVRKGWNWLADLEDSILMGLRLPTNYGRSEEMTAHRHHCNGTRAPSPRPLSSGLLSSQAAMSRPAIETDGGDRTSPDS